MHYGNYRFSCTLDQDAELPVYKGSTFRGGFGHALRQSVCTIKRADCGSCLLKDICIYIQVFEQGRKKDRHGSLAPHPFVIVPPHNRETRLARGSAFDCHLLLFGKANQFLPCFIHAFEQMGKNGIGKHVQGRRAGFKLNRVTENNRVIYPGENSRMEKHETRDICLDAAPEGIGETGRVKIEFQTPLRIKFGNRLHDGLLFHILVRAMLRRVSSLFTAYGNGEPDLDYKGLVKKAQDICLVENRLSWFDWKRYSLRQDQSMLMGGIMGSAIYEGRLDVFMPLLDFCSKVHLGKQTSFGLGKLSYSTGQNTDTIP